MIRIFAAPDLIKYLNGVDCFFLSLSFGVVAVCLVLVDKQCAAYHPPSAAFFIMASSGTKVVPEEDRIDTRFGRLAKCRSEDSVRPSRTLDARALPSDDDASEESGRETAFAKCH